MEESESEEEIDPDEFVEESDDGKRRRNTYKGKPKRGICDIEKPEWLVKSSKKVEDLCET